MLEALTDRRCLLHKPPFGFPERHERLERVLEGLDAAGLEAEEPGAHDSAREAVEAVHGRPYADRLERCASRGDGLVDSSDNPLGPGTLEAAWAAVEVNLHAADRVAAKPRSVFAAVRPPGHHAERETAMGFCYFNNVAVAADYLRRSHGVERVAIFDFDVHHGNGTQHLFEERAEVYYASVHQYPFYPGTGAAGERGLGEGEGATLNVPLPAGSGDERYQMAIDGEIVPALAKFSPEVLLISVGFDAWRNDPLGGMRVSREAFRNWGHSIGKLARRVCGGRVLSTLEGGYDLSALGDLTAAYLEGLGDGLG